MRHLLAQGPVKSDGEAGWDFIAGVICDMWQGPWESWICCCVHPADSFTCSALLIQMHRTAWMLNMKMLFIFCDLRDNLKNSTFGKLPLMIISKTPVGSDKWIWMIMLNLAKHRVLSGYVPKAWDWNGVLPRNSCQGHWGLPWHSPDMW